MIAKMQAISSIEQPNLSRKTTASSQDILAVKAMASFTTQCILWFERITRSRGVSGAIQYRAIPFQARYNAAPPVAAISRKVRMLGWEVRQTQINTNYAMAPSTNSREAAALPFDRAGLPALYHGLKLVQIGCQLRPPPNSCDAIPDPQSPRASSHHELSFPFVPCHPWSIPFPAEDLLAHALYYIASRARKLFPKFAMQSYSPAHSMAKSPPEDY